MVRALLARNCDARHADRAGRSALLLAAHHGHADVLHALLEQGKRRAVYLWFLGVFFPPCFCFNKNEKGAGGGSIADVMHRDKQGMSALDHAAAQGKTAALKVCWFLLKKRELFSKCFFRCCWRDWMMEL